MALARRSGQRFQASIWPGFVDAMTGLLLVLMFVLMIFMVVQFVLRDTISGQEAELGELSAEVQALSQALGLERDRSSTLAGQVGTLSADLAQARDDQEAQAAMITRLTRERDTQALALSEAQSRITGFEAQVAGFLAERAEQRDQIAGLEDARDTLVSEAEALNLALAQARDEIDAEAEAARLAAARADALEQLSAQLRADAEGLQVQLDESLADAAAAQALRDQLSAAESELTAMTLALEEQRAAAEQTLTLLAAARAAEDQATTRLAAALLAQTQAEEALSAAQSAQLTLEAQLAEVGSDADALAELQTQLAAALEAQTQAETARDSAEAVAGDLETRLAEALLAREALSADLEALQAEDLDAQLAAALAARDSATNEAARQVALLAEAQALLSQEEALSADAQRDVALLNEQVASLRQEVAALQDLLDVAETADRDAQVQITALGERLNTALARVAAEQRRRAELEEAERLRAEAEAARLADEAADLERYRSDFFGELSRILEGQDGVRVVGDRFVFSSEVLFSPGKADLSPDGQAQIAAIAQTLRDLAAQIPSEIDWIIRVDGHTDNVALSGLGDYADNWELSQARALSVVRFMVEDLNFPPERLAANGFGEFRPIAAGDSAEARAQNRRIELKLTER